MRTGTSGSPTVEAHPQTDGSHPAGWSPVLFRLESRQRPGGSLTTGTVGVGGIAAGPDGNVWFTDHGTTAAIGRIAPDGAIAEFSNGLPTGSDPYKITADPTATSGSPNARPRPSQGS